MKRPLAMLAALAAATTVAAAVVPAVVAVSPASAAAACRAEYTVVNQWGGGFQANVTITNLGDQVSSWRLGFDFADAGQRVSQGWNATWSQSGAHVTAASAAWNGTLAQGASTSIGFVGTFTGTNATPTGFSLNGTTCVGASMPSRTPSASPTPRPSVSPSVSASPTPSASPTTSPSPRPTSGPVAVLDQVHTAGRVVPTVSGDAVRFSWPGVAFEGRFRGTGVGVVLEDPAADYDVQVDGRVVTTLVTPAAGTHWVRGLTDGEHTVRLVKRSESPWATSTFRGLVPAAGGAILARPAARDRQIEFIGDSHTAGYGLESTSRDCTGDQVNRTTNADRTFGALTARALGADHQLNAFSGRGMVRNYDGGEPGTSYRTYYDRALLAVPGDVWARPASWRPDVVVVGLGTNDFSTALRSGERWATQAELVADYTETYHAFLDQLRARYGADTTIVISASDAGGATMLAATRDIVADRRAGGDARIVHWHYTGLDLLGCHWHPSAADHRLMADQLTELLTSQPITWDPTSRP